MQSISIYRIYNCVVKIMRKLIYSYQISKLFSFLVYESIILYTIIFISRKLHYHNLLVAKKVYKEYSCKTKKLIMFK